eukprot:TRINITY_DN12522_c0_g1_i1.p1 TRINITY_DN12522_c0_g1~~TRINITY_DN12522_c0_g1_i1.p1  ORF type:complete len:141 (+),score=25.70 TRINITY_DN12522_c0_g1_i1:320-742(+)
MRVGSQNELLEVTLLQLALVGQPGFGGDEQYWGEIVLGVQQQLVPPHARVPNVVPRRLGAVHHHNGRRGIFKEGCYVDAVSLNPSRVPQLQLPRVLLHRCLLYTSDAADEEDSVDLGGRRIIKKKKKGRQVKKEYHITTQ